MYFWKINKLKELLANRNLTSKEAVFYYIFTFAFVNIINSLSQLSHSNNYLRVFVELLISLLITVYGTIFLYNKNGGASGKYFLERSFALGWVVCIRCFVIGIPILIFSIFILTIVLAIIGNLFLNIHIEEIFIQSISDIIAVIASYLLAIIIFWRTGIHIQDVADKSKI